VVEPYLGGHSVRGRHPVQGSSDLASVWCVTSACRRVVCAPQLDDRATGVFHDIPTGDEVGTAQPYLTAGRQSKELLRWLLHEVIGLDVDLARERHLS